MASKTIDLVQKLITPIVESLGYEIVDIEFAKKQNGQNLTIVIDNPNGIKIEDCEKVHNAINEPLDELNPTDDVPYTLNVSSPGLDRPIKNQKDFLRNKGKEVEIKLFAPQNGKKIFVGNLEEMNENNVSIISGKQKITLDLKTVAIILPVIKF
ncbi:MAG: ribosome maturation factor RimP [Clostridia bacterium]